MNSPTGPGVESLPLVRDNGTPTIDSIVLKLAARCNIRCTYCYWFRDPSAYTAPRLLEKPAQAALIEKLGTHVHKQRLKRFRVSLHGGEPLLFGKKRFRDLCQDFVELQQTSRCRFSLSMTTNAVLLDEDWYEIIRQYGVGITVSLDGPKDIHDQMPLDHAGAGTYDRVIHRICDLRDRGIEPYILSVCNPNTEPDTLCKLLVDDFGLKAFDVLIPDATRNDNPSPIATYYKRLFDLWYDVYAPRGVRIRICENLIRSLLGFGSGSESFGYGPLTTVVMATDGTLEPSDVLRIAGKGTTRTGVNIQTHELDEIQRDPIWREAYDASLHLAAPCRTCPYDRVCGGGHLASRWADDTRWDNPSVYCADFLILFTHVWRRIRADITIGNN